MEVIEAILARHSVRDFSSKPVPRETVMKIMEVATHSPSGGNGQPWEVFIASGATIEGPEEWTPGDKGGFELNADGTYRAEGLFEFEGNYTFEDGILTLDAEDEEEEEGEYFPGYYIYPDEIKSITMLGDGKELEWELVKDVGLKIKTPKAKPCEHAFTLKIVRGYDN